MKTKEEAFREISDSWTGGPRLNEESFYRGWDAAIKAKADDFNSRAAKYNVTEHPEVFLVEYQLPPELFSKREDSIGSEIYNAYPRKIGRRAALKAIAAAIKRESETEDAFSAEDILEATKVFADVTSKYPKEDRQYIPYPATWFNRGSYADDPSEWARVSSKPAAPGLTVY